MAGIQFPLNTHGLRHKKAGVSANTDISAARATPSALDWPVIFLTPSEQGQKGLQLDANGSPVPFNNESEARAYFGPGDPSELSRFLFNPVPRGEPDVLGPGEVFPLRVGSPTQAVLPLENPGATDALQLTSRDYGTKVNAIEVKVEKTADRHTLTFRNGTLVFSTPVLGPQFVLLYSGAGTAATLTITRTGGVATTLATTITGAASDNLSVDLQNDVQDINGLVALLNSKDNYTCRILVEGIGDLPSTDLDAEAAVNLITATLNEQATAVAVDHIEFATDVEALGTVEIGDLVEDVEFNGGLGKLQITNIVAEKVFVGVTLTPGAPAASSQSIYTGVETTAILPAIAKEINDNNTLVTAVVLEPGNDGTGLDVIPFTRLDDSALGGTAGTNPTVVLQDWLDAQDQIETKFKGKSALLLLNTTDRTIHASFTDFAIDRNNRDAGQFPLYSGAARGEAKATALARGPFLNHRMAKVVGIGGDVLDAAGAAQQVDGVFGAAMVCGQVSGSGLTQPVTFNRTRFIGLDRDLTDDDIQDYIKAGLIVPEEDPDKGFVWQIAVTTAQSGNRLESIVFLDHQRNTLERAVRSAVKTGYLGKALTRFTQGGIRDTVRRTLNTFLDTGDGQTGFLASIGSITVEGTPTGLVKITFEVEHIDEIDFVNITGFSRIATFVDISLAQAA